MTLLPLALAVGAGLAGGSAGAAPAAGSGSCGPGTATTLAQSVEARVYRVRDRRLQQDPVYACRRAGGPRLQLNSPDRRGRQRSGTYVFGPPALHLNGPVVAYAQQAYPVGAEQGSAYTVVVATDLRETTRERVLFNQPRSRFKVGSLRVARSLAFAFIACPEPLDMPRATLGPTCRRAGARDTVISVSSVGEAMPTRIGAGRRIDPSSLRLSGSRLSWRDGGRRRSAVLR